MANIDLASGPATLPHAPDDTSRSWDELRILWIYPELPYPLTTGYLRGYYLLRELGQRHSVTFLSLAYQESVSSETIQALQPYTKQVAIVNSHSSLQTRWQKAVFLVPFVGQRLLGRWNVRSGIKRAKEVINSLLREQSFDLVLFCGRETLPLLEGLKIPIVVDCGDTNCTRILQQMQHAGALQKVGLSLRYFMMRQEERRVFRVTPFHAFISERDRENLCGPSDRSAIVPQGVDSNYWKRISPPAANNCIVFHGVMNYHPNADAALFLVEKILPRVRKSIPRLEVFIVGRDPLPELLNAARSYRDVTVTGAVDDVRPYLERATVSVAALRFASGVQNKVLEAMAMEVPVVTTPAVADGLRMDGRQPLLVVGQTDEEIADGIVMLLTHTEARARYSAEGRRFVEEHCLWSNSAEKLVKLCRAAIGRNRPDGQAADPSSD